MIDAAQNWTGVVKTEAVTWPFPNMSRVEVYQMMDNSGLQPVEFYNKYFPTLKPEQITVEVAGHQYET